MYVSAGIKDCAKEIVAASLGYRSDIFHKHLHDLVAFFERKECKDNSNLIGSKVRRHVQLWLQQQPSKTGINDKIRS